MKNRYVAYSFVFAAIVAAPTWVACSGGDVANTPTDGGTDATQHPDVSTVDAGVDSAPVDAGIDLGLGGDGSPLICNGAVCTQTCCITVPIPPPFDAGPDGSDAQPPPFDASVTQECLASCPDGSIAAGCTDPAQCTVADPYCCGTAAVPSGSFPGCFQQATLTSACAAACNTNVLFQCNTTDHLRLCTRPQDCAGDPNNASCCTFQQGGQNIQFCAGGFVQQGATSCLDGG
jgi:hypothetical protein